MEAAFETYGDDTLAAPLIVIVEHATNLIPPPMQATEEDHPWLQTHWGWDIGIADTSRSLIDETSSFGLFSRFSRLICDPNRKPEDGTWIRTDVEGYTPSFNRNIDDAERQRRFEMYHDPYHEAIDQALHKRLDMDRDVLLLSMHSFTPKLGEELRPMEIGVLYDDHEAIAKRVATLFEEEGFVTALNEPYSGFDHLIYSANRHGRAHNLIYLEFEVRQDLIDTPEKAKKVGSRIAKVLHKLQLRRHVRT
ncbi:MAG: hypothetical protein CL920_10425 [Deltaproteobacteria bacterium]|nr:hypothetical protein [Deltaproteobacteria bacterium]MBU49100.1 hypothetical protein [Deltaproteobacteria bacterium]|tara:strand:- start:11821 stop:12570 length:750 start_codon:yes stop_codon:yes gene_type:complete